MPKEFIEPVDEIEAFVTTPFIGSLIEGEQFICVHTCARCESSVETAGAGHPNLLCSSCEATGHGKREMSRSFEWLEVEE